MNSLDIIRRLHAGEELNIRDGRVVDPSHPVTPADLPSHYGTPASARKPVHGGYPDAPFGTDKPMTLAERLDSAATSLSALLYIRDGNGIGLGHTAAISLIVLLRDARKALQD